MQTGGQLMCVGPVSMSKRSSARLIVTVSALLLIGLCAGCGSFSSGTLTNGYAEGLHSDGLSFDEQIRFDIALDENDSRMSEALAHYGQALVFETEIGTIPLALKELDAARRLDPDSQRLYGRIAAAALTSKPPDTNTAVRVLTEACSAIPDSVAARVALAAALQLSGQPELAVERYHEAINISPTNAVLYMELAKVLYSCKKDKEAAKVLAKATRKCDNPRIIVAFASIAANQFVLGGAPERSIPLLEIVAENLPASRSNTYVLIGQLLEQQGDFKKAGALYRKAADSEPPIPEPFLRLTRLLLRNNDLKGALQTMEDADVRIPDNMHILRALAKICHFAKMYARAADINERLFNTMEKLGCEPTVQDYIDFAAACDQAGNLPKAESLLEKCIAEFPDAHQALNYLAYTWAEKDVNLEKGLDYVLRALKQEPDNGAYVDTLGWIYFKMKDYHKALEQIKRASELLKSDPTIADHLATIYMTMGDKNSALSSWKHSFSLDPENENVARKLEELGMDVQLIRREAMQALKDRDKNAPPISQEDDQ